MTAEKNCELRIETDGIKTLATVYHALDHPNRIKIIHLLHIHEAMSVLEIADKMDLDKESVSQHLSVLKKASLVFSTPHARFRYYALNYKLFKNLNYGFES